MELSYEKLPYQEKAVKSVIDTLTGYDETATTIETDPYMLDENVKVTLSKNNQQYLNDNYLYPFPQFNIEMETGTGKTMVYLKTIMEMHRRFNEKKFIIVVPSRAIKTGVEDSIKKLQVYLSDLYNTDRYNYFVYNSKKIAQLQNFDSSNFEIMITTVQAFNSDNNIINQEYNEGFFGGRPLDLIKNSNPIVIIDEPQSVDSSKIGKKAISALNPKFVLRYSATHKDKQYPLLYKFGPVEAYKGDGNKRYVKQIETLGTEINTHSNIPTIELKNIELKNGVLQGKVGAYFEVEEGYEKKILTIRKNDKISEKTKNKNYEKLGRVVEINSSENFVEFENGDKIEIGVATNEISLAAQMTSLVRDHLDRELTLQKKGIKVLSLIFIDSVDKYRIYTKNGTENGEYAKLFESIYNNILTNNPKYEELNDYHVPISEVHDGYFAMDSATKKRPSMYKNTRGDTQSDETAYETIMSNKEELLTQYDPNNKKSYKKASKIRFIFSHSTLKEGWDNPNVFQILTITTPKSDLTRRQKIGRGLRICVNQKGERVYGDHNIVTIYANETFEEFAEGLQKEYIDLGLLDRKIQNDFFTGVLLDRLETIENNENNFNTQEDGCIPEGDNLPNNTYAVTQEDSANFVSVLKKNRVIKKDNNVSPRIIRNLNNDDFEEHIISEFVSAGGENNIGRALVEHLKVKFNVQDPINRKKRESVEITSKENKYFKDLWEKINNKVSYKVKFSENELIDNIVNGDNSITNIQIPRMSVLQTRARMDLMKTRIGSNIISQRTDSVTFEYLPIVDVTKQISDQVGLTRKAIIKIIQLANKKDSKFIDKIKQNPALFIRRAINNISLHQRSMLNKSLVYLKTGEVWSSDNLTSFEASNNTLWQVPPNGLEKTLFKQISVDSQEERQFANALVNEEKVKYFLKLPKWFKIPTPFGNYNPDWAVLSEMDNTSRLYFIIDTKTTREKGNLSPAEQDKLNAAERSYNDFENYKAPISGVAFQSPVKVIGDLDLNS
ncbi:restriction endonuclease [Staphylococcus saprophyticus]|uniref:restriction endonuclease n=1 Tax=Staphylococcus saprophyticus TaxID=29385 RepID=UPI000DF99AAA|nr:DEAD/DEAH box helicase family protein [Staphylococcus saprophyticus]SUN23080.1 type III restriction-modification system StyLTI enzyme res [Staphylococcus saprophyticus]